MSTCEEVSVRSVDNLALELCPLAHVHSTSTPSLQKRKICLSMSTIQRLMRFSAPRRLATVPLWFLFFFQFPLVGHIKLLLGRTLSFRNSCFFFFFFSFFLRRALFLHFFLLRFLALRARQAPWSQHPRVDATLRLHLVVVRHTPQFHLTSRSHPVRRPCCRLLLPPLCSCGSTLPLPLCFC